MIATTLREQFRQKIAQAALSFGFAVSDAQTECLIQYLELLIKWNKAYNLTAIRDPQEMFVKHLLDSLSITSFISGDRLLDVGTGAGLPGIPMAILFPHKIVHLLDSNGKKTRFLIQAKLLLGLTNVEVINQRVEQVESEQGFDIIMSRAFTALDNMVSLCQHLLAPNGRFLAMKGLIPEHEMKMLEPNFEIASVTPLVVPGCQEQRHLITLKRK